MKFVSGRFIKIYQNIRILVKNGQQQWILYIKSSWEQTCYVSIKSRTKVVEKNEKKSNSLFLCVLEFAT